MLLRLCQLKSPLILILGVMISSCSWRERNISSSELVTTFPNRWFKVNEKHTLVDQAGIPQSHMLFDTTPEFSGNEVNVVITIPKNSQHAYSIDLNSGQRFYGHTFCKQKDIWSEYKSSLHRPPFSVGYIPRVLDQLGEPQKVIVWSKTKNMSETAGTNFYKVRLIGAYVEQICHEGNCLGKSNWLSRMVFLSVDAEEPQYQKITNIKEFEQAFNWPEARAYLGNIEGHNFIGDMTYPSTRIGELIEFEDAFDFFKNRSILLTQSELNKIQKGCHALYDALWEEVGKEKPEDKAATTVAELEAKIKLREALKQKKEPVGFAARFQNFTKKYFKEISTCEKFVYHGNVNRDPEAFWFLSYVGLYYRLHREGYFFDCKNRIWQRNVLNDQGQPIHDLQRDVMACKELEIDQAMDYLPNFLKGLKGEKEYFRFIDYDNHAFGTHQKLYAWVKVKVRKFDCSDDPNSKFKKEIRVFPEDVNWKEKNVKDIADKMKIIY